MKKLITIKIYEDDYRTLKEIARMENRAIVRQISVILQKYKKKGGIKDERKTT